jgi:hypothetical protein
VLTVGQVALLSTGGGGAAPATEARSHIHIIRPPLQTRFRGRYYVAGLTEYDVIPRPAQSKMYLNVPPLRTIPAFRGRITIAARPARLYAVNLDVPLSARRRPVCVRRARIIPSQGRVFIHQPKDAPPSFMTAGGWCTASVGLLSPEVTIEVLHAAASIEPVGATVSIR